MAIAVQVDTLEGVDDSLKSVYDEEEGKFILNPDKYAEFKATGLKKKNKELLDAVAKEKAAAKKFEKFGDLDEAEIDELLELRHKAGENGNKGADAARLAELEKEIRVTKKAAEKVVGEKTDLEKQLGEATKSLRYYKLTVPLRDIAVRAGVIAEDLDLVMLDVARRFTLGENDAIVLLDDQGDPSDVTPKKFFETVYKEQRPKFYQASGAGGSGASNGTKSASGKKTIRRVDFNNLSAGEQKKIALGKEVEIVD